MKDLEFRGALTQPRPLPVLGFLRIFLSRNVLECWDWEQDQTERLFTPLPFSILQQQLLSQFSPANYLVTMTNKNSIALSPVAGESQQSPCWKQKKIIGTICFAIAVALAATLGVVFVKRPATPPVRGSSPGASESEPAIPSPSTSGPPIDPPPSETDSATVVDDSGVSFSTPKPTSSKPTPPPTPNPTEPSYQCFPDRNELKTAIDRYVQDGCGRGIDYCTPDISNKYGWPMGSWCVESVRDMSTLFYELTTFNEDITAWDVSGVTNMRRMFYRAHSFNQDISKWNTGNVADMHQMFHSAHAFNRDLPWKTSSVKTMYGLFCNATSFNKDISGWDISNVDDMYGMFWGAKSFNQNLCSWRYDFPYNSANTIFWYTDCYYSKNPNSQQMGPFCASSCSGY